MQCSLLRHCMRGLWWIFIRRGEDVVPLHQLTSGTLMLHPIMTSATIYGTRLRRTANGKRSIRVFSSAQGKCWKDTALTLYHNVWIWPWLAVVLWCIIEKDEFAHISVSCHAASRGCSPKCRRQYCLFDPQLWKLLKLERSQVGHRMSIRKAECQPCGPVSRWRSWNRRLSRIRTEELPFLVALIMTASITTGRYCRYWRPSV